MIVKVLCGGLLVGAALTVYAVPAQAWDCSKPENWGVAECPYPSTTTTIPVTTTTLPVATTTVPTPTTTTTEATTSTSIPKMTSTTVCTEPRGCCLAECEGPPTSMIGTPLRASRQLPFTGGLTFPLLGAGSGVLSAGAFLARKWRSRSRVD